MGITSMQVLSRYDLISFRRLKSLRLKPSSFSLSFFTDENPKDEFVQGVHRFTGTSDENLRRLLADVLGAQQWANCHAHSSGRAGQGKETTQSSPNVFISASGGQFDAMV